MTVAEFIEQLKELDQDRKITYDYGLPIEIEEVWEGDDAEYTIA